MLPGIPLLLFGPYAVPACQVGDRLRCQVQGDVVVAGFHDALIRWPIARGRSKGRLILCGELVRAVRKESLAAVAHWWGVAFSTAWGWRQALASARPLARRGRWTETEDALVFTLTPAEAAERTGRTLRAVYNRRHILGLPRDRRG